MSFKRPRCKVTVLKRTIHKDLVDEYVHPDRELNLCEIFSDGQEFIIDDPFPLETPKGFCPWAWADIRSDLVMLVSGGNVPWMKEEGTVITGCTD